MLVLSLRYEYPHANWLDIDSHSIRWTTVLFGKKTYYTHASQLFAIPIWSCIIWLEAKFNRSPNQQKKLLRFFFIVYHIFVFISNSRAIYGKQLSYSLSRVVFVSFACVEHNSRERWKLERKLVFDFCRPVASIVRPLYGVREKGNRSIQRMKRE